jgi:hypothetical protein
MDGALKTAAVHRAAAGDVDSVTNYRGAHAVARRRHNVTGLATSMSKFPPDSEAGKTLSPIASSDRRRVFDRRRWRRHAGRFRGLLAVGRGGHFAPGRQRILTRTC